MCFSVKIEVDINRLASHFTAKISQAGYESYQKLQSFQQQATPEEVKAMFNLKRKSCNFIKSPGDDCRVYPGYFTNVIVWEDGQRVIRPMRYRVRPHGSREEIPTKFNVFNARLDSLEQKRTWKPIFMNKHAIFPFYSFYEWVNRDGKKSLISFTPRDHQMMWAACLWDHWTSRDGSMNFSSFAVITDSPPKEVVEMGHDRCPVFLKEELIDSWLQPKDKTKDQIYHILQETEQCYFQPEWTN